MDSSRVCGQVASVVELCAGLCADGSLVLYLELDTRLALGLLPLPEESEHFALKCSETPAALRGDTAHWVW